MRLARVSVCQAHDLAKFPKLDEKMMAGIDNGALTKNNVVAANPSPTSHLTGC